MTDIDSLRQSFLEELSGASQRVEIEALRTSYLGRRSFIKEEFRRLGELPEEERKQHAVRLNDLSQQMQSEIDARLEAARKAETAVQLEAEWLDVTLPGQVSRAGAWHPLTEVEQRCLTVLRQLGFERAEGPEVEDAYHNFDALNIPQHHPARDMQDTFWLDAGKLLRSHTTTIQARVLGEGRELPIKIAAAGRVYRNEAVDATHLAMFHQLEGFWLEPGLSVGHLKSLLTFVATALYGEDVKLRFKPKYYPYTEPSLGLDIACTHCGGTGCEACHHIGWVTIIGAGMIHPAVLREFGYDRDGVTGIAFGWGSTRMTAQRLGVSKVKPLYSSDQRLLSYLHRGQQ
ncbi:phenylalanine--tRNA ligase subunit alpha [Streptomyces sp. OfavH-34-F]|uniref:phenylalanine--tRNA ligase subunit alpha n=1 Tax=unclassified Streptomyces TaxID=2593676 RepID=UPI001EF2A010|nr:phenylalanine--tRNA ligase subunit alpha [Streptomyces sp. OfavH-34-F]MCG7525369.1 phenylalanine--tRNA ligase subunit alpha [Streptomyces sp. OfavH-34-F]